MSQRQKSAVLRPPPPYGCTVLAECPDAETKFGLVPAKYPDLHIVHGHKASGFLGLSQKTNSTRVCSYSGVKEFWIEVTTAGGVGLALVTDVLGRVLGSVPEKKCVQLEYLESKRDTIMARLRDMVDGELRWVSLVPVPGGSLALPEFTAPVVVGKPVQVTLVKEQMPTVVELAPMVEAAPARLSERREMIVDSVQSSREVRVDTLPGASRVNFLASEPKLTAEEVAVKVEAEKLLRLHFHCVYEEGIFAPLPPISMRDEFELKVLCRAWTTYTLEEYRSIFKHVGEILGFPFIVSRDAIVTVRDRWGHQTDQPKQHIVPVKFFPDSVPKGKSWDKPDLVMDHTGYLPEFSLQMVQRYGTLWGMPYWGGVTAAQGTKPEFRE